MQTRILAAVDCIVIGFDGRELKLLLTRRAFEPAKGEWSLMGGFVRAGEAFQEGATRILKELSGLENVHLEQLYTFDSPNRDPIERTISIGYFTLIYIDKYQKELNGDCNVTWFSLKQVPQLIFDHNNMVEMARAKLFYKAAFHPILYELLPEKFTLPNLQNLYSGIYDIEFDKRNFRKKVMSTGLLIKQKEKERSGSKKGAFYYKLDKKKYKAKLNAFSEFIPAPNKTASTIFLHPDNVLLSKR